MPNIKSAKKRLITNEKARKRNKARLSALKTTEKKLRNAVEASEKEVAQSTLSQAYAKLDKAVKYGIIHKNKANRKKAQFNKLVTGIK